MKLWIAVLMLALAPGFARALPIDNGWYTESNGLDWLDVGASASGSGWRLATKDEFSALMADFGTSNSAMSGCMDYPGLDPACEWSYYEDAGLFDAIVMLGSASPYAGDCAPGSSYLVSCYDGLWLSGRLANDTGEPDAEPFALMNWEREISAFDGEHEWEEHRTGIVVDDGGPYSWSPYLASSFLVRTHTDLPVPAPATVLLFSLCGLVPWLRKMARR